MAHFALLWKARTIEKYRQNYENEKYLSIQDTNITMPQKSLSQRLRCYRQDTQKRFSKIFQRIYPEGSSLSNFFLYLRTDQTCLHLVLKSLLGFLIGLGLTYLCFLFLVFQLSISLFHATIVSSVIGVLLTMGLAFSYRIRCLIFLLLPQFFSRAGRYTLTCYALVLILTGPATNTLKNSEVLTESMACRQEHIKTLLNEVKDTARRPLNAMRDSIKIMVQKIRLFARELKRTLLKVNRLTLSVLETIQSTFSWLQWLSGECNQIMGSPFDRCLKVLKKGVSDYKRRVEQKKPYVQRMSNKIEEVCSNVKQYRAICVFTDFVNGSFVASIRRRLKDYAERMRNLLYLQIHVHHTYSFSSNTSHSASQVAAGIVTEIRKRADPLLTWLSWSSYVTSLFILLIIFRAKYYQHMFETRSRFDNKYITKELRDLDLNRLRHGRETILPLNKREKSKYVSTTSFRLVASEKIHLNRSIVFMAITTFKLLIHMVADYSLYWVLMTIRHHGKNQTPLPFGVPNAGMHITGTGRIADMFRSLLAALTSPLERPEYSPSNCLPDPHPPNFKRYTQIGILIFLLWFFALFEPYGLRLRHVIMGLYRPERAKARAEWLYNHILRTRGGFMKFARRKLHRSYKYCSEEKYTFKRWLNEHIPFCWLRCLLGASREEAHCLLCGTKQDPTDPNTKLQKCHTLGCPGIYCCSCFSDIGELCTICLSPSDYGDLSDVSLENGSSDESDDDSGGSSEGDIVPKNDNVTSEPDTCDHDSDDILLPKPLRGIEKVRIIMKNNEIRTEHYKTRYRNDLFYLTVDLSKPINTLLNVNIIKDTIMCRGNMITKSLITVTINLNWKIFENTSMNNQIMETKDINKIEQKHVVGNSGQDEHKSKQTKNKLVSNNIGDRNNTGGNSSNGSNEKSGKIRGSQGNGDNNYRDEGQNDISDNGQEFPCYSLKQLNTAFYTYWLNMKNHLFNTGQFLTQAIINNTLGTDAKNNYKSRKKVNFDIPKSNEFRSVTENSREYRIFTFLAEREWVLKKNIRYESTEKGILLNEKPNIKTVEHLKDDLYSHTVHYKELTQCTSSSSQFKTYGKPEQNEGRIELTSCSPSLKQHVLVCDDCKFNCLCPRNPLNNCDLPLINREIFDPVKCMSCCAEPKPKKSSALAKIKACFKSLFSIKKRKKRKVCRKKSKPRMSKKIKTHPVIIEKKDRSIQFDENDCPYHNRSIQVFLRGGNLQNHKGKWTKAELCPFDDQCMKQDQCDPLCPVECDCKGHGLDPLSTAACDPLCPIECQCYGEGPMVVKCDPLCPDECTCKDHETDVANCDTTCSEVCSIHVESKDDSCENETSRLIEHIHKLHNSACKGNKLKKHSDEQKNRATDAQCQCSEYCCERKETVEEKFCSCAIQCIPPECDLKTCCYNSSCSSCTVSIISDGTLRSDFTGTDSTCYHCYDYYGRPRQRKRRVVFVTTHNQSTGTDAAIKCNVGTITNERGLVRKNRHLLLENNQGDGRAVDQRFTENRSVSTKKIVTFKNLVHIIPSNIIDSALDLYTPSRYLLESQRYYNELFAYMPHVYPISTIQERIHKRISSQGNRSRYRKGDQAKRREFASYEKRKKTISKKQVIDPLAKHRTVQRKINVSSFENSVKNS